MENLMSFDSVLYMDCHVSCLLYHAHLSNGSVYSTGTGTVISDLPVRESPLLQNGSSIRTGNPVRLSIGHSAKSAYVKAKTNEAQKCTNAFSIFKTYINGHRRFTGVSVQIFETLGAPSEDYPINLTFTLILTLSLTQTLN